MLLVLGLLSLYREPEIPSRAPSAMRAESEDFQSFLYRFGEQDRLPPRASAQAQAKPFRELNLLAVPEWKSSLSPIEVFAWIRDARQIERENEFARRPSWLYPDDGCFARAEYMARQIKSQMNIEAAKLFIFGNLKVRTRNHPRRSVSWWYHVVPVFRSGKELFVFDPAIEDARPLLIQEWAEQMGQSLEGASRWSICDSSTYDPADPCQNAEPEPLALEDQMSYLDLETERVLEMKRPTSFLQELPPWRGNAEKDFLKALKKEKGPSDHERPFSFRDEL